MTEDNEYSYHIKDTVKYTAEYASDHPESASKVVKVKLSSLLCTIGSDINPTPDR